jgi:hypothetical protein
MDPNQLWSSNGQPLDFRSLGTAINSSCRLRELGREGASSRTQRRMSGRLMMGTSGLADKGVQHRTWAQKVRLLVLGEVERNECGTGKSSNIARLTSFSNFSEFSWR